MLTLAISGDPATPSFVALSSEKKPKSLKDSLHDYFVRTNRVKDWGQVYPLHFTFRSAEGG